MDLVKEIGMTFGLLDGDSSNIPVYINEDNAGVFTLGNCEPQCMTFCSKHYVIKYHWFCAQM